MSRVIRDYTASLKMNKLSAHAERFFLRLLTKLDDYGNFHADKNLLRSALFPLSPQVRLTDLSAWLLECEAARLITVYESLDQKKYVHVHEFRQKMRWPKRQFPPAPPEVEDEVEVEEKRVSDTPAPDFNEFLKILNNNAPRFVRNYFPKEKAVHDSELQRIQEFVDRRNLEISKLESTLREKNRALLVNEAAARGEDVFKKICLKAVLKEGEAFWKYYEARGFMMTGGARIRNFQSAFDTWLRRKK